MPMTYTDVQIPTEEQRLEKNKYLVEFLCENGFDAQLVHNQEAADMMCLDGGEKVLHASVQVNNKTMILAYDRSGYCLWDLGGVFDFIEIEDASAQEVATMLRVLTGPSMLRK